MMRDVRGQWTELAGTSVLNAFTNHLRGEADNDIVIVSDFGEILHYNGTTFKIYQDLKNAYGSPELFSCAIKNNLAIVVGCTSAQAVIAIGRR